MNNFSDIIRDKKGDVDFTDSENHRDKRSALRLHSFSMVCPELRLESFKNASLHFLNLKTEKKNVEKILNVFLILEWTNATKLILKLNIG